MMETLQLLRSELERDYNQGRLLELGFYNQVRSKFDNITVLHEYELRKLYGWHACSVDFLLEFDAGIVLVQCKYRNTRRRENLGVKNFLASVNLLKEKYDKPFLFGLWISRLAPFKDNEHHLHNEMIETITDYQSVDDLVDHALKIIAEKTYIR